MNYKSIIYKYSYLNIILNITYPTIEYPANVTIIFNTQKLHERNNAKLGILRISFPDDVSFINNFPEYNHLIITSII